MEYEMSDFYITDGVTVRVYKPLVNEAKREEINIKLVEKIAKIISDSNTDKERR